MLEPVKPPTIRVSVDGIKPKPITMNDTPQLDWKWISELPPFQMFAIEKSGKSPADVMGWIGAFITANINEVGPDIFYVQYSEWHEKKGYWPNESPLGRVINGN